MKQDEEPSSSDQMVIKKKRVLQSNHKYKINDNSTVSYYQNKIIY